MVSGTKVGVSPPAGLGSELEDKDVPTFRYRGSPSSNFELWQHTGRALFRQDGGIHTMGLTMCMAVIALSALTALFAEGELFG